MWITTYKYLSLHQRGKAASVVLGAEGWSDTPDPSELMLGGVDPPLPPLPGSLRLEGHEDEEAEDEAVLLWVINKCLVSEAEWCDCPDSNSKPALPSQKRTTT